MLGSHLSIAGGMVNALHEARRLKLDCVQVFTKSQRQWRARVLPAAEVEQWWTALRTMKWEWSRADVPRRVVAHNSYLINLAQPDPTLWRKSVAAHRVELERCETLGIPYCVSHPGAHLSPHGRAAGSPNSLEPKMNRHERLGLRRIARALDAIHRQLPGYHTITCLETTVGSGTNLGYNFHQLAYIRAHVREPERVGFCMDTCHVTAAGYDMSTDERALAVLDHWDSICGLQNLRAFHMNDSVGGLGSRRDRHAHIGQGCCGRSCFTTILNHPALSYVPKILETPKGTTQRGVKWDWVNLRRLRRMIRPPESNR